MTEADVRDFICNDFTPFTKYIVNLPAFEIQLETEKQKILTGGVEPKKILISDLIKLSVIDLLSGGLPLLDELALIDKEFELLKTISGRGKQPSVDIMAYNESNYCLALIELKISDSAEREAVTELSAYNQGLQNKFRGLSSLELLWMPISTDWRITTKSAIAFQMYWHHVLAVPLKMVLTGDNQDKVTDVKLECFNPIEDLSEIECRNLFSYECFEAFDYATETDIEDKTSFINYVASICSSYGVNGFIIFHEPVDEVFPYLFTLCIYNPYKGYLHKRLSLDFIKEHSEKEYYAIVKKTGIIITGFTDIDFKSDEIEDWDFKDEDMDGTSLKHDASWEKDFLSVGDFAENPEHPNINFLFNKIKEKIDSNGEKSRAIGAPNFNAYFNNLTSESVDYVMYLGIHLDLISNRINLEHKRKIHTSDFFSTAKSFAYLKNVFQEYN